MAMITDLSNEVIYIILEQKIIDFEDVVNFSLTCGRFNDALDNNSLWRTKLCQRWPYLKKIYNNRIQNNESINFKDEVQAILKCRKVLLSYLSLLSEKLYNEPSQPCELSNSDLKNFDILFRSNIAAHPINYHFLKAELLHQIKMSPLHPKCNLTHQYYSKKLLPFLQRRHLEDVCLEFMNYPEEHQLLENAARNLIVPKNRTRNVKYAVGMVVTVYKKDDLCVTGVIIGWDEIFNPQVLYIRYWYQIVFGVRVDCLDLETGFHHCDTTRQPCYLILGEDDEVYYAAQDTLTVISPRWIEHSEIGRYFCRFTNDYYVPNEVLTRHYPYDQAIYNIYRAQKQIARKKRQRCDSNEGEDLA